MRERKGWRVERKGERDMEGRKRERERNIDGGRGRLRVNRSKVKKS